MVIDRDKWHAIRIEKIDGHLYLYLDGHLRCHYIHHTPMRGARIGLLSRDTDFALSPLKVSVGSQNAMVSCLAVPDAFLADKHFSKALAEYRRIAVSFAGRAEGREALFKAGVTLLEEAQTKKKKLDIQHLYFASLDEFAKLRTTQALHWSIWANPLSIKPVERSKRKSSV